MDSTTPAWSPTLERALRWAAQGHEGQVRKGSPVPYIEHPMAVAMILDRAGFPEEVVVAGLLHDLVEDTDITLEDVRSQFGDDVAEVVAGCSEVKLDERGVKRPWADRKRDHLDALRSASVATRAVTLADKLHNLACIALDLDDGRPVWESFNAPRADVLAYYRATLATCGSGDSRLEALRDQAVAILGRVEVAGAWMEKIGTGAAWRVDRAGRTDILAMSAEHTPDRRFGSCGTWHDGLEPALARGWTPAGPGCLVAKEVIACVVRTRGGSPNGSRRVARRAAASLAGCWLEAGRVGLHVRPGLSPPIKRPFGRSLELTRLSLANVATYGSFDTRGWWRAWYFTGLDTAGRRAEGTF